MDTSGTLPEPLPPRTIKEALEHANLFDIHSLAWDPILRAAAALAQLGFAEEARAALEVIEWEFPLVYADPAHDVRGYLFIDDLVDELLNGLSKSGWKPGRAVAATSIQ